MAQEKSFYVYTHSRADGSVFYVGKGYGRRAWNFAHRRNPHHLSTINKTGAENVIVTVHPCASEQEAFELEVKTITALRLDGVKLCNMTDGGEGASGRPVSPKVLAAFEAQRALKVPKTEKARKAQGERLKKLWATNPVMKENVIRMSDERKGVKRPQHVVDTLVACHKGKKQTGVKLEKTLAAQKKAIERAKDWHKSDEGLEWHREHGKRTWENRELGSCNCKVCGREIITPYPTVRKFCDNSCRRDSKRLEQGLPIGLRPSRRKRPLLPSERIIGK